MRGENEQEVMENDLDDEEGEESAKNSRTRRSARVLEESEGEKDYEGMHELLNDLLYLLGVLISKIN